MAAGIFALYMLLRQNREKFTNFSK